MQELVDREERRNTQYAIKNNEEARLAGDACFDSAPRSTEQDSALIALQEKIRQLVQDAQNTTLYEMILLFWKRRILMLPESERGDYYMADGVTLKESKIYDAANIIADVWSRSIKKGVRPPNKHTLFKLMIALHLNREEAKALLLKGANLADFQHTPLDDVILSCLNDRVYAIGSVYERIEKKQQEIIEDVKTNGGKYEERDYFPNIYDSKEKQTQDRLDFKSSLPHSKRDDASRFKKKVKEFSSLYKSLSSSKEAEKEAEALRDKISYEIRTVITKKSVLDEKAESLEALCSMYDQQIQHYNKMLDALYHHFPAIERLSKMTGENI